MDGMRRGGGETSANSPTSLPPTCGTVGGHMGSRCAVSRLGPPGFPACFVSLTIGPIPIPILKNPRPSSTIYHLSNKSSLHQRHVTRAQLKCTVIPAFMGRPRSLLHSSTEHPLPPPPILLHLMCCSTLFVGRSEVVQGDHRPLLSVKAGSGVVCIDRCVRYAHVY